MRLRLAQIKMPNLIATGTALAIGAGVSAAGTVAQLVSGSASARAAEKAGQAQVSAAQQQVELAKQGIQKALEERQRIEARAEEAAQPSLSELQSIGALIDNRDAALQRSLQALEKEEELLQSIDPAIKAAAEETTKLLRGQQSRILGPLQAQRRRQKAQLEQSLAGRLGSGFRTSSAGIQALNQFDDASALILNNAQQQAISTASGVFQGGSQARATIQQATSQIQALGTQAAQGVVGAEQNIAARRAAAATAGLGQQIQFGGPAAAQGAVVAQAGAPFRGEQIRAQTLGQVAGGLGQIGARTFGQIAGFAAARRGTPSQGTLSNLGGQAFRQGGFSFGDIGTPIARGASIGTIGKAR